MNAEYDRVVGTTWALSTRPGTYTSAGSLAEAVAYLAGMLDRLAPPSGGPDHASVTTMFAEWLEARYDVTASVSVSPAARICSILAAASQESIALMWREFEVFGEQKLGVPMGSYPLKV